MATTGVRADITARRNADSNRAINQALLRLRMVRVIEAQHAVRDGEPGATGALRGALIDVAALAEVLADQVDDDEQ